MKLQAREKNMTSQPEIINYKQKKTVFVFNIVLLTAYSSLGCELVPHEVR